MSMNIILDEWDHTPYHPAFPLLWHYATNGCPIDCRPSWSLEQLQAAVEWGAHPSVKTPEAIQCLQEETLEKVQQGFAKLIPWSKLKANPPANLEISPLAAVPHQSQPYLAICDLLFEIQLGGIPLPSINAATVVQAQLEVMKQLWNAAPRLIAAVAATSTQEGPITLCKMGY